MTAELGLLLADHCAGDIFHRRLAVMALALCTLKVS